MKKSLFFLLLGALFLGGAFFWGRKLVTAFPKQTSFSELSVDGIPQSLVFLNDKNIGKTPLTDEKFSPGEYTLRLTPEVTASFSSWERKIKLNPGILTYVNYIFGQSESESAGEILTLEKTNNEKGEIVVISDPEGSNVLLDGKDSGAAPKAFMGVDNGEHEIHFSAAGYHERNLKVKVINSHRTLVNVKLAKIIEVVAPVATISAGLKVKILGTPTGWLRVRTEPSVDATEAAKVKPGEEYPLLEENKDWLKIQYREGKEGWISSQYVIKVQ